MPCHVADAAVAGEADEARARVVRIIARVHAGNLRGVDHVPDLVRCLHRIATLLQL